MAANVPDIRQGTGNATLTFDPPRRMFLVENRDPTNALNVGWNGSPGAWILDALSRKGNYVVGGVTTITITATGAWQIEGSQ